MAQDNEQKLKETQSRQKSIFRLWMSVLMFVGILLVFGAVVWKHVSPESKEKLLILQIGQSIAAHPADGSVAQPTKSLADLVTELITNQQDGLAAAADLVRDLGIALVISVIATVVIERYASDRLREHIAYDVLSAAYAKVIPEKIYTQVADNVFRSNVYRRNWEVHINVNAQQVDRARGIAIINVIYSYDLDNLNEHKISHELSGAIDLDVSLRDEGIPKFKSIAINDEHNRSLILETHTRALLLRQNESTCTEGNLTFRRNTREMSFAAQVPIAARRSSITGSVTGSVTVRYEVERAIRIPGDYVLSAPVPADGIKIILNVEGFELTVIPLHPDPDALRHPQPDTWRFDAGILPWQGFRFRSKALS